MEKSKKSVILGSVVLALAIAGIAALHIFLERRHVGTVFPTRELRCAIALGHYDDTTDGLISGYNYELLQRYAESRGLSMEILRAPKNENWTDSLRDGLIDILVVPVSSLSPDDSILISGPVDSLTRWAVAEQYPKEIESIDEWVTAYNASEECSRLHGLFIDNVYEPFATAKSGIKKSILSPYDSLIIDNSEKLGWDWRLVTAVIYQESQFRINAHSSKGAQGLMQLIPTTADRYDVDNMFDPAENIRGGVTHLKRLQNIFRKHTDTPDDLRRFTLAAYNAGEGNILKCIHYADSLGMPARTWKELEEIMPSQAFKWKETQFFVSRIYSYYWAFSRIYRQDAMPSGQSVPDLPLK